MAEFRPRERPADEAGGPLAVAAVGVNLVQRARLGDGEQPPVAGSENVDDAGQKGGEARPAHQIAGVVAQDVVGPQLPFRPEHGRVEAVVQPLKTRNEHSRLFSHFIYYS